MKLNSWKTARDYSRTEVGFKANLGTVQIAKHVNLKTGFLVLPGDFHFFLILLSECTAVYYQQFRVMPDLFALEYVCAMRDGSIPDSRG